MAAAALQKDGKVKGLLVTSGKDVFIVGRRHHRIRQEFRVVRRGHRQVGLEPTRCSARSRTCRSRV